MNPPPPLFFFTSPLICLYLQGNVNAEAKRRKGKTIKTVPGSSAMEAPAMDDLGKADDIDWAFKNRSKGSKQIHLSRHCICYCLSRAAWGECKNGQTRELHSWERERERVVFFLEGVEWEGKRSREWAGERDETSCRMAVRAETAQLTDGLERSLLNLEVPIRTKADSGSCSVFLFFFYWLVIGLAPYLHLLYIILNGP